MSENEIKRGQRKAEGGNEKEELRDKENNRRRRWELINEKGVEL